MNEEMINNFVELIEIIKKEFNSKSTIGFNIKEGMIKDIQIRNGEDSVCIIHQTTGNTKKYFTKKNNIRIINGYLVIMKGFHILYIY